MSADTLVVIVGVAGAVMLAFACGMWLAEARLRRRERLGSKEQQALRDVEIDRLIKSSLQAYGEARNTAMQRRRFRDADQPALDLPMMSGEAQRMPPTPGLWPIDTSTIPMIITQVFDDETRVVETGPVQMPTPDSTLIDVVPATPNTD